MVKGKIVSLTLLVGLSMFLMLCNNIEYGTGTLNKFKSYAELPLI